MTFSSAWGWLRRRCAASPPPSVPASPPSKGLAPQGLQSQGSGSRSGSQ